VPRSVLWQGMNMIGMVESECTVDGKTSKDPLSRADLLINTIR